MHKPIYDITPFTALDFPHKPSCILWFAGCNMRCLYCYNPDIVLGKGKLSLGDALHFLDKRKGLLDGVVLSGGECTMHRGIANFINEIRAREMQVKIDTNGTNPEMLHYLLDYKLLDYVALDFKALPNKFRHITQSNLFLKFERSLEILIQSDVPFEVRTTVHTHLLNEDDIKGMGEWLLTKGYKGTYYLQKYVNDTVTLGKMENPLHWLSIANINVQGLCIEMRTA